MLLWDTLLIALREIRRHILRSFLTVLGIVIGVASVITMVTLGNGATVQVTQQIKSMGSNLLMVTAGKRLGPGRDSSAPSFKIADAEAIARDISSIDAVAPASSQSVTAVFGNENWSTTVTGTTNQYLRARNCAIQTGREFSTSELRAGAAVCIIGDTIRKKLFGPQDPVGKRLRLGKLSFQVVGLLEAKGQSSMGQDQDDIVLIPIKSFQRRLSGNTDVGIILVSASDNASTEAVKEDIENLMRERRHISKNEEDNFNVMDMTEISNMLTGTTRILTALLGAVAAVSLVVGGIGIMNIMLVSVTERTREIGIRLAIGALEREVLMQFLVEAVVLSSAGGLLGIVVGLLMCAGLKGVLQVPFVFNPGIVIVAFLFSAAVGVIFGYFPAFKAASLDPIEALRHE
ncbi:MAG TPA: ABC transporter permease [Anaerohalosphaeraceae bacterium]|jgi:putative ABC transport system permease protein|nr:ABC transporter permease [Anaerohalosphaeraceae bacterium]HOT72288.1 ABC transporter permease [Anaerohalosphaeraceae bacterium]HQG05853.1 ABC transporter permease [Anaerohalosphaeraceae bacterium]HQI06700.1 ABC transporter permease [Anaerohalosphaeraceae bacterium]HQJ67422.1 ABC transporter permease [Anaerohalosphaeraceae bacterium]